ncbi:MAG: tol-pal system protein YbgF [Gammaproteobacteria bacterium]|nr:tol-pal system protein YbgF [Gammaproteobacteria bacterium]
MRRAATRGAIALLVSLFALPSTILAQTDLSGRVAKLEQSLSNRGLLDLVRELEDLKREVQNLRGELENQAYTLDQLKKSQTAMYLDLDRRLQGMQGAVGVNPNAGASLPTLQPAPADAVAGEPAVQGNLQVQPTPVPGTDGTATGAVPGVDPTLPPNVPAIDPVTGLVITTPEATQNVPPAPVSTPNAPIQPLGIAPSIDDAASEAAYREAFGALKAGEYDQAIAAFNAFQQTYPNSQYGDNAQFWLAEAHYVKRDFAAALPEYQKMLIAYPASKKLSHAMLKIGYSYSELSQPTEARAVLEDLQQRFPGSAAAQLAAQRIAQLPPAQ